MSMEIVSKIALLQFIDIDKSGYKLFILEALLYFSSHLSSVL